MIKQLKCLCIERKGKVITHYPHTLTDGNREIKRLETEVGRDRYFLNSKGKTVNFNCEYFSVQNMVIGFMQLASFCHKNQTNSPLCHIDFQESKIFSFPFIPYPNGYFVLISKKWLSAQNLCFESNSTNEFNSNKFLNSTVIY